jgi:hypothetical protein
MIPFFVVDRPISLEIIKGLKIPGGKKIGLMAHANTSANFRQAFRDYPRDHAIKMCDSAIFHPDRSKNTYAELFTKYEEMGAKYGVIIDVLRDAQATIESAREALQVYDQQIHHFELVAVAQGKNLKEFLDCYAKLKKLGYTHIAVGGFLHKTENTARYIRVRDEELLCEVLKSIRQRFNPDWLFVLGCLRSSRLELFRELNVWGDYKGWIFEYKKRDDTLHETIERFSNNHLAHASLRFQNSYLGLELKRILAKRRRVVSEHSRAHKELLSAKKAVKNFTSEMYDILLGRKKKLASALKPLKSRAILRDNERALIARILTEIELPTRYTNKLNLLSTSSRQKKRIFTRAEKKLSKVNEELLSILKEAQHSKSAGQEIKAISTEIITVLGISEQTHRIDQVRKYIEDTFLSQV